MKRGKWTFKEELLVLEHDNGYQVDLEELTTSAELADWIFQIAEKAWCSDTDLGIFVRMLNEILCPQGTLCSQGKEQGPIDVATVVKGLRELRRKLDA